MAESVSNAASDGTTISTLW